MADVLFEQFSRHTLIRLLQEICLQGHLLTLSFVDSVERRFGPDAADDIARKRFIGIAGVAARRVQRALGPDTTIGDVLRLHPAFHPSAYIDVRVAADTISLYDCPAVGDRPGRSWADILAEGETRPLDAMVQAVDARARCTPVDAEAGAMRTWRVTTDADQAAEAPEVTLTKISTGAEFVFEERPT
jgi:hypothetical protein